jgi:hypothetical protein
MKVASTVAYPLASVCLFLACSAESRPLDTIRQSFNALVEQAPLHDLIMPPTGEVSTGVILSDVMGKTQTIAIFSGLTRDVDSVAGRLHNSGQNATVLAPDNSIMRSLKRKPWEDPEDYDTLGANAYAGSAGEDRAHQNLERFVTRHIVPESPWAEGKKVKTLAGNEIWWETKNGHKKVVLLASERLAETHMPTPIFMPNSMLNPGHLLFCVLIFVYILCKSPKHHRIASRTDGRAGYGARLRYP